MTKAILLFITFYQLYLSPLMRQILGVQSFCRYSPTCSEYSRMMVKRYGILYGLYLSLRRILSCQPFAKIYD